MTERESLFHARIRAAGIVALALVVGVPILMLVVWLPIATWHVWGAAVPLGLGFIGLVYLLSEEL